MAKASCLVCDTARPKLQDANGTASVFISKSAVFSIVEGQFNRIAMFQFLKRGTLSFIKGGLKFEVQHPAG
jgi:hypothetical protein